MSEKQKSMDNLVRHIRDSVEQLNILERRQGQLERLLEFLKANPTRVQIANVMVGDDGFGEFDLEGLVLIDAIDSQLAITAMQKELVVKELRESLNE